MIKKIAHLADIHIRKVNTRNEEYRHVFENTINLLKKDSPDRIVIAGDLFHDHTYHNNEDVSLALWFIKELSQIAKVILTRGNHDIMKNNSNREDSIQMVTNSLNDDNIVYYNKSGFYIDENVCWVVWHHKEGINPWNHKKIKPVEGEYTFIDLFHDPVAGCQTYDTSTHEHIDLYNNSSYTNVKLFKGDYSFFGDIHHKQYFTNKTKAYPGSLICQNFTEGDDQFHGYLLWDIENSSVEEIEVPNNVLSFHNYTIDQFFDFDDIEIDLPNPAQTIKLNLIWETYPGVQNNENVEKIHNYFKKRYNVLSIKDTNKFLVEDKVEQQSDARLDQINSLDTQQEFIKEHLENIGIEDKYIDAILELDKKVHNMVPEDEYSTLTWDILKFRGENFQAYAKIEQDWTNKNGIIKIGGENEVGKTTLYRFLSYIFHGTTLEKEFNTSKKFVDSDFVNNRNNSTQCWGEAIFEVNKEYYGVRRETKLEYKRNGELKGSPTKVSFYKLDEPEYNFTDDNNVESLNEHLARQTQKIIDKTLGTFENFVRLSLTTADTLNRYLTVKPSEFTDTLLEDCGLDIFSKKLEVYRAEFKKVFNSNKIKLDVLQEEEKINNLSNTLKSNDDLIINIKNNVLPDINNRLNIGRNFKEEHIKKLIPIDESISNLDVNGLSDKIHFNNEKINELNRQITFNQQKFNTLNNVDNQDIIDTYDQQIETIKREVWNNNNLIKDYNGKIIEVKTEINIYKGEISQYEGQINNCSNQINELNESKTCPTCNRILDESHRSHIEEKIQQINLKIHELKNLINNKQQLINKRESEDIHNIQLSISNLETTNQTSNNKVASLQEEVSKERILKNEYNEYISINNTIERLQNSIVGLSNENTQIGVQIERYELQKQNIEQNASIQTIIDRAQKRINEIENELQKNNNILSTKETENTFLKTQIENIQTQIDLYKKQVFTEEVYKTYESVIDRTNLPTQLLRTKAIPLINDELSKIYHNSNFRIWIDEDEMRIKFALLEYLDKPIDSVLASGKQRTFTALAFKFVLNRLNMKSKPNMMFLDEVSGKLVNQSVEEFIELLHFMKQYINKIVVVEHNHDINEDYLINVKQDSKRIGYIES